MPKSMFIDFKAVKSALTMERVLVHYGILDSFNRKGDSLSGPCPIHKGSNPTQFRVSISKNVWNCFSECKRGGNALDFISRMENVTVHAAALKAMEWFGINGASADSAKPEENSDPTRTDTIEGEAQVQTQTPAKPSKTEDRGVANKPLKFRLDKLERSHAYLAERGITLETLVDFGAGFCGKGMMAGRIAIPIRNVAGEVVAYAGRYPGEPPGDTPKYRVPPGFHKSLELFNIDRAIKEPAEKPLVIVEGFFDCMKLHQAGYHKVVALMGSSMSTAQEELVKSHTPPNARVIVMLDEDEAGQTAREDIAPRLARFAFVRIHVFDRPGMQPDQLTSEEANKILLGLV